MYLVIASLFVLNFALDANAPAFDYKNTKVRGVNLGGWLVIEPWITPTLFAEWDNAASYPVCEWTYGEHLGKQEAYRRLRAHWETFYTEADFKKIASWGVNILRVPIGYWAFEARADEPYVQGQEEYLDRAINWARIHGLKIWIDLHGAPGSQNGFDNSGHAGAIRFLQGDTMERFLSVWDYIARKYSQAAYSDVVIGFECVNEPANWGLDLNKLKTFYRGVITRVNAAGNSSAVVFSDAFMPASYWEGDFDAPNDRLVLDVHKYQVFSDGLLWLSPQDHCYEACNYGWELAGSRYQAVLGEWSGAMDDCTKWLNGYRKGARYDGTLSGSYYIGNCNENFNTWSAERKAAVRQYVEAQLDAYEMGSGWIFWCCKTTGSNPAWSMEFMVNNGLFPQPFTARQFPKICGN